MFNLNSNESMVNLNMFLDKNGSAIIEMDGIEVIRIYKDGDIYRLPLSQAHVAILLSKGINIDNSSPHFSKLRDICGGRIRMI